MHPSSPSAFRLNCRMWTKSSTFSIWAPFCFHPCYQAVDESSECSNSETCSFLWIRQGWSWPVSGQQTIGRGFLCQRADLRLGYFQIATCWGMLPAWLAGQDHCEGSLHFDNSKWIGYSLQPHHYAGFRHSSLWKDWVALPNFEFAIQAELLWYEVSFWVMPL